MKTTMFVLVVLLLVLAVAPIASAQTLAQIKEQTAVVLAKVELAKAEAALKAVTQPAVATPTSTATPCPPSSLVLPTPPAGWGYDKNFPVVTQEVAVERSCGGEKTVVTEIRQTDKARKQAEALAKIDKDKAVGIAKANRPVVSYGYAGSYGYAAPTFRTVGGR